MNTRFASCALLLAVLVTGCAKESKEQIIPGYISPGQFRPRGVLASKEINVADLPGCSGEQCVAVYTNWLATNILVSGFAISDKDSPTPTYNMKVTQDIAGWKIVLITDRPTAKGVRYERIVPRNDIQVDFCRSNTYSLPACPASECDQEYENEGTLLVRADITFNSDITLVNADHGDVVINNGDRIRAQAYNISSDSPCPP